MDQENKNTYTPGDDKWLDSILGTSDTAKELGPDELAIQAAGLTHPDDLELEKILAEDWDSVPDLDPETNEPIIPVAEEPAPEAAPAPEEEPFTADAPTMAFKALEEAAQEPAPAPADEPTMFFAPIEEEPAAEEPQEEEPAPEQEEVPPQEEKKPAPRKTRPEKKKGYGLLGIPHIVSTAVWLLIILIVGVSLGRVLWLSCADLMAFGKPNQQVTITITENDTIDTISQKLGDAGLIEYPTLFKLFATLTGKDADIDVGTFTLNSMYDYNAMINAMITRGPAREEIDIMIPEGYTCAQIFALLEEKGVCTVAELEAYVVEVGKDDGEDELAGYWFLEGVPRGDKYWLEGYLFPDTYRFYTNDTPERVIGKFLDGFDYRFTDVMKEKLDPLNERYARILRNRGYSESYIEANKLTMHDIVIIASMIEKETASDSDSYDISSVIFNRLTNPGNYMYLNIDATIIYALGGNIDPETGLTKPLTTEDLRMDHPYNTYTEPGLPPGPISNPGRNSLDAALSPNDTSYYFYVYNPHSGEHMYAKTQREQDEHIRYINSLG